MMDDTSSEQKSIEEPPNNALPPILIKEYDRVINELIGIYIIIDRRASSLDEVHIHTGLIYIWSNIKFIFLMILDIILIFTGIFIVLNLIVFVRNRFHGHWRYKFFSKRLWLVGGTWLWKGELLVGIINIGPLTSYLLHRHFHRRLSLIRRHLLMDTGLSEEGIKDTLEKIDRALVFWGKLTPGNIILSWIFPLAGPAISVIEQFYPEKLPWWSDYAAIVSFSYLSGVFITAFVVKRGLMLGGEGNDVYLPGFIDGSGYYEKQRGLLKSLNINVREYPLDMALVLIFLVFFNFSYKVWTRLITDIFQIVSVEKMAEFTINQQAINSSWVWINISLNVIILYILWFRRKKLGRL